MLQGVDRLVYNAKMVSPSTSVATNPSASERILLTAHDLFYQYGTRATGIDRIIAESGVTKVTFYRHFPSKNALVRAYLEYRHQRWMSWFTNALQRHGKDIWALVPALGEWFRDPQFRGCAFINTVVELAGDLPEVVEIAHRHKDDMIAAIANLLPAGSKIGEMAQVLGIAVDGAIVRAQFDTSPEQALSGLEHIVKALIDQP